MKKHAFTIIELMVVLVVISILVGITLPRFKGMRDEANVTRAKSELKTIQVAVESYYINQNPQAYPDTTDTLVSDYLLAADPNIIYNPIYDPWRSSQEAEYDYILSDNGTYYVIFSYGMDKEADISGINDDGELEGAAGDDVWVTNAHNDSFE